METQEERKPLTIRNLLRQGRRQPSPRAIKAVEIWTEGAGNVSKADALREAGYSPSVVDHPDKVFNAPTIAPYVQEIMAAAGIEITDVMRQLRRKVFARNLAHTTFPPYNAEKALERRAKEEAEGVDLSEQIRGEQLTDADIRQMLSEVGCMVRKITHGDMARHVYYWTDDNKTQVAAIKQIVDIFGVEAPKKVDLKGTHTVGIFRLSDLRKKSQDEGVKIYEHKPNENNETETQPR